MWPRGTKTGISIAGKSGFPSYVKPEGTHWIGTLR